MKTKILAPILFIIVLVVAFEIILRSTGIVSFIFPRPSIIFQELVKNWAWILDNLVVTLYEAVTGFGISILVGVVLALTCLFAPFLRSTIVPVTIAIRNVPFVAIAPILFMIFGYGPLAQIVIVVLVSFFPIMANLLAGFGSVNKNQLERFYVLRATKWQLFTKLQLPSSVPYFIAGVEVAVSSVVIAAIVGELMGTTKGLGLVIIMSVSQYRFPLLMASVLVTTIASILITWIVRSMTSLILKPWTS